MPEIGKHYRFLGYKPHTATFPVVIQLPIYRNCSTANVLDSQVGSLGSREVFFVVDQRRIPMHWWADEQSITYLKIMTSQTMGWISFWERDHCFEEVTEHNA